MAFASLFNQAMNANKPATQQVVQPKPVQPMGVSDYQMSEIWRKAKTGEGLSAPTQEKQALYDYYKANPTTSFNPGGITGYQLSEIQRKAASGEQLMKPTAEKQAIYNAFSPNKPKDPLGQVDFNQYKTQAATIEDLQNKYGFDYSREYAARQAQAEYEAKQNAIENQKRLNSSNKEENLKSIDNNLMDMADSLDRNYFQQYMQQAQGQVNSGLNAGIAADQDLRLAMSRQAEMGGAYRDANLGRMQENNRFTNEDLRLADLLGQAGLERVVREDGLFNERLQQGFQNAMALSEFDQRDNLARLDAALQQREQDMDKYKFDKDLDWRQIMDTASQTGRFVTPEMQGLLTELQKLKSANEAGGITPAQRQANAQRANAIRSSLESMGYDSSLVGSSVGANNFSYGVNRMTKTSDRTAQDVDRRIKEAALTGMLDGKKTTAEQQRLFENLLAQSEFDWTKQFQQASLNEQIDARKAGQTLDWAQLEEQKRSNQAGEQLQRDGMAQEWKTFMTQFNNVSATDQERIALELYEMQTQLEYAGLSTEQAVSATENAYKANPELFKSTMSLPGFNSAGNSGLGALSARYESNGNPGAIGRNAGDIGGASYGAYQLTTASGNAQKFANQYGGSLKGLKAGTSAFDKAWKAEASKNPEKFKAAQHDYIKRTHYDPGVNDLLKKTGINANNLSSAIQNVVWSISVQHGPGAVGKMFKAAGVRPGMSDKAIIDAVYKERMNVNKYFSSSSSSIKKSVKNRFAQEWKDALAMM